MRKSILALGLIGILGCTPIETKFQYSEVKHDLAIVSKQKIPARSDVWIVPVDEGCIPIIDDTSEKNIVKFLGSKTQFETNSLELYNRFREGDSVEVSYQEVTKTRTEVLTRNGNVVLNKKLPAGYKFIDAKPLKIK